MNHGTAAQRHRRFFHRFEQTDLPGPGITLIIAGLMALLMALAFIDFSGVLAP